MSRCFPFPPPGYEKKARSDHTDLLTKEKRKEKKHKKEKRDKEKREGKEKTDKDRSKEKHREKKDKKEKQRDKKKDKDKNRVSNEGRSEEQTKGYDEEKVWQNTKKAGDIKDSIFVEELGRRIKDDERGAGNQMAATFTGKAQRRIETMGSTLEKERGKSCEMVQNLTGTEQRKIVGSGRAMDGKERSTGNDKVQYLTGTEPRKIGTAGNEMVQNLTGTEHRKVVGTGGAMDGKERCTGNDKVQYLTGTEPRKIGSTGNAMEFGRRIKDEERGVGFQTAENSTAKLQRSDGVGTMLEKQSCTGNEMVHNLTNQVQARFDATGNESATGNKMVHNFYTAQKTDGLARSMEKDAEKTIEGKEKTKSRKGDRKGEKHKEGDRGKGSKGKDKGRRDKEKKKDKDKMREKSENKHIEVDKLRLGIKKEVVNPLIIKPSLPLKDAAYANGNHKRKEINGFIHENDMRPNKMPRTASSSHLPVENGRKIDLCHFAAPGASDTHGTMNNMKVERVLDNKGHKINGMIESQQQPSVTLGHSLTETSVSCESTVKPPHPDSKYLSQILSVPKMEEWPESDEQEWLFSAVNLRQSPKTKSEADQTPQVWAEALQIESADVLALPYVIPY